MPDLTRRRLLSAAGGTAAALALTGCGGGPTADDGDDAWAFTDDLGRRITRPTRPRRVVAYTSGAAALWDFGIRPVGVYGPTRDADGKPLLQIGNVDLTKVRSVGGESYDGLSLERLVALEPDLVIASLAGSTPAARWVIKDDIDEIEKICPVCSIQESGKAHPEVIAAYGTLARRLGADVAAPAVVEAKAAFEAAGEDLRAALAEKPGLRTEFAYGDAQGFYVASPKFYPTLIWYAQLGMSIARHDDASAKFLEQLSWENAAKYPADLLCIDVRDFSLQPQQMAARFPTFAGLPAVRAGQLGGYNGEPFFSYEKSITEVRDLTTAVRAARVGVAG